MGSFPGHALPGSIFIFLGLGWMYSAWLRYFICRHRQKPYYVSISFPFHCCSAGLKLPLESFIVLFGTTLGIMVELGTGLRKTVDQDGISSYSFGANNLQHFTMYFMFFLVGILELLQHYHFTLPSHIDVVVSLLAFSAEGLLFYFHVHARDPVDIQLHILLVLSIGAIVICSTFVLVEKITIVCILSMFVISSPICSFISNANIFFNAFLFIWSSMNSTTKINNII
ncbi:unnamed protein product [Didymodactylos carnosus]|uniref:Transmembrane protein 45B n=1 Tax=Didymodactylos carnosus TaxID=1234261 RepID=A0A8S2JGE1_9BILA|nr:unnamed protein product [Didymodactylos carnosus]CAF3806444.1 unnamed protein product [Didymodactylos carnosus]